MEGPQKLDASSPAAWGQVLKQVASGDGRVAMGGRKVWAGKAKGKQLSTGKISKQVMGLVASDTGKGAIASRYHAHKELKAGLDATAKKINSRVKAKVLNFFGIKTSSQKKIARAQQAVEGKRIALKNELKAAYKPEQLLSEAHRQLDKSRMIEQTNSQVKRQLCFHRCLDRVSDNPIINAQAKKLGGMEYGFVLDSMAREIKHITSENPTAGNYTSKERSLLQSCSEQLQWAAETSTMVKSNVNDFPRLVIDVRQGERNLAKSGVQIAVTNEYKGEIEKSLTEGNLDVVNNLFVPFPSDEEDHEVRTQCDISNEFEDCFTEDLESEIRALRSAKNHLVEGAEDEAEQLNKRIGELKSQLETLRTQLKDARTHPNPLQMLHDVKFSDDFIRLKLVQLKDKLAGENGLMKKYEAYLANNVEEVRTNQLALDKATIAVDHATARIIDHIMFNASSPMGVMIPGGLSDHAMMYKIQQMPDKTYTFSILNTGLGVELHHKQGEGDDTKYQTHLQWSGLSFDQVSDPKLIKNLVTLQQRASGENIADPNAVNPVSHIYSTVTTHFGMCDPPSEKSADYHKAQIRGTCTQQVTNTWMHQLLPESTYRKFKADMTDHSLKELQSMPNAASRTESEIALDQAMATELVKVGVGRRRKALPEN